MTANTFHTPASLANETYKFLEHKQICNVATLTIGYSGKVPEIYKVQWVVEIDRVDSDGVKKIDKFVAIGSGAPYARGFLDQTPYAPDMTREKVKNFCQDALIHASLFDYLSWGEIDLYFITENGYTTKGRRVLNTYLERYKFHQDDINRALLLAIPSSFCCYSYELFIKEMLCFPKRKISKEFIKDMPI
ncbi:unnamed protein product [Prunus armeniaca]|uniref:Uncharacterized protein n=1 Tax=Prunus armeniaca TaxID=36596 RepID=A0A6J5VYD7_PRUAR|nr:unnamed protein product [Prunus armeniaca]